VQNEAVSKYLDRYAEAEAAINLPGRQYDYSLVIPAFNEAQERASASPARSEWISLLP
jgi:hypothetical protein